MGSSSIGQQLHGNRGECFLIQTLWICPFRRERYGFWPLCPEEGVFL